MSYSNLSTKDKDDAITSTKNDEKKDEKNDENDKIAQNLKNSEKTKNEKNENDKSKTEPEKIALIQKNENDSSQNKQPTKIANDKITINAIMVGQKFESISISPKSSVLDLKNEFAKEKKEDLKSLSVIYMGRFLKDEDSLVESNIVNGASVHIMKARKTANQTNEEENNNTESADIENAINSI
ncbi:hypothetical protein MHBO_003182, partial [Bonamia ostreae]